MENGKKILILSIVVCLLFSIAGVCASETNDTSAMANADDNLKITEDNQVVYQTDEFTKADDGFLGNANSAEGNDIQNTENDGNGSDDSGFACSVENVLGSSNQIAVGGDAASDSLGEDQIGDFNILQNLINDAQDGDSITLDRNYTFSVGLDENLIEGIVIDKILTIDGNGYTINAVGKSRIFNIEAYGVKLNNITFINAKTKFGHDGGAIKLEVGGTVTNCNFIGNNAYKGSAIFSRTNYCFVVNCSFVDNSVTSSGGAIYLYSNGAVVNCSFINNYAWFGGAIYCDGPGDSVVNCSFVDNSANNCGGAVYCDDSDVTVVNCSFMNNFARDGGALYWSGDQGSVVGSSFVNNSGTGRGGAIHISIWTDYCMLSNCNFIDNSAWYGDAIYLAGDYASISNSSFINNRIRETILRSIDENGFLIFTLENDGGNNNYIDAIYTTKGLTFENVTYYCNGTIVNSNNVPVVETNRIIVVEVYSNDILVDNVTIITDGYGNADYGYFNLADGDYNYTAYYAGDNHYTYSEVTGSFKIPFGDFNFLQLLIKLASEGDVITLNRNYTFTVGLDENLIDGIVINKKSLTIDGNGYTIDAAGKSRIFNIKTDNVKLNNITFTNAYKNGQGGAIYVESSNVSVIGCNFVNNSVSQSGSAIRWLNQAYHGSVIDCSFVNNTAFGDVGAVIDWGSPYASVVNCSFINNTASGKAGAIYFNGQDSSLSNCTFVNNSANYGGAIYWQGSGGSVSGSSFVNNSVSVDGGAICWHGSGGTVVNCSFEDNSANYGGAIYWQGSRGSVSGSSFVNNSARVDGGAIRWYGFGGTVVNCSFEDNSANYGGGAVYWHASNGAVVNCSFMNNSANERGGAIYWLGNLGSVDDCSFVNNSATGSGGAILVDDDNFRVYNSNFIDNYAVVNGYSINWVGYYGSISNSSFINRIRTILSSIVEYGALIFSFESRNNNYIDAIYTTRTITFDNVTYYCNGTIVNSNNVPIVETTNYGVNNCFIVVEVYSNDVLVDNVTLMTNSSGNAAYGCFNLPEGNYNYTAYHPGDNHYTYSEVTGSFKTSSDFNFLQSLINVASEGDVITLNRNYTFTVGLDENLIDGIVINKKNLTIDGNGYTIDALGKSRIFNIKTDNVKLNNITFTNAYKKGEGGAIYVEGTNVSVIGCSFVNNSVSRSGSAIRWIDNAYYGSVIGCSFVNNTGFGAVGSVIDWGSPYASVVNCSFINNSASGSVCAIYFNGHDSSISNSNFVNNSASGDVGAIFFNGQDSSLSNCTFVNNTAKNGGAIQWHGNSGYASGSSFVNNSASVDGGAIHWYGFEGTVVNCSFEDNSVTSSGGAVYWSGSNGAVVNCSFEDNSVTSSGGAVYWSGSDGAVVNCSFVNNSVTSSGGAVYWSGSNGAVVNCSFMNNSANERGGAIYWFGNSGSVEDCSFVNNSVTGSGGAILVEADNFMVCNSNFIDNYATEDGYAINWAGNDGSISNSSFINRIRTILSSFDQGGILFFVLEIIGYNNYIDAIFTTESLTFDNVTYYCNGAMVNSNDVPIVETDYYDATNFSIVVEVYSNDILVDNVTLMTDIFCFGAYGYSNLTDGDYNYKAYYAEEGHYAYSEVTGSFRTPIGDFNYLQSLIYWASEGDVITLDRNYTFSVGLDENIIDGIEFFKEGLTIDGNGYTIDALGKSLGIFHIDADGVKLENITFININHTDWGDGNVIFWEGNQGSVVNCSFVNNSGGYGSAINWYGHEGSVVDCTFIDNSAIESTINWWGYKGSVVDCNFVNNSASVDGGAIYWYGYDGSVVDCSFIDNSATDAGAIYWFGPGGSVVDCSFVNNSAEGSGGAILGIADNCMLSNCSFIDNSATDAGAIYWFGPDVSVVDCSFVNNSAEGRGGAIFIDYRADNCMLSNCSFIDNSATDAGAIYWFGPGGSVVDCSFVNNSAEGSGGAVLVEDDNCMLSNCSFIDNSASLDGGAIWYGYNGTVVNCSFVNNSATNLGNAIYVENTEDFKLIDSSFRYKINNTALNVVYDDYYLTFTLEGEVNYMNTIYWNNTNVTLNNISYWNGQWVNSDDVNPPLNAWEAGQDIIVEIYSDDTLVDKVAIVCNANGQAVYDCIKLMYGNYTYRAYHPDDIYSTYFEVTGSFTLNDDLGHDFSSLQTYIDRAYENATLTLTHNYTYNESSDYRLFRGIQINKTITIDGNGHTIDAKNERTIFYIRDCANVVLENIIFINAKASAVGGAIDGHGDGCIISDCYFVNCSGLSGGAIRFVGWDISISGCSFVNCSATWHNDDDRCGGAISWLGTGGSIVDCSFVNCSAAYGGAVYWNAFGVSVVNCSFINNSADFDGGAIYWNSEGGSVVNCSFENNSANRGGAIYITDYYCSIFSSSFKNNKASCTGLNANMNNTHLRFTLEGNENYFNAVYLDIGNLTSSNITYWDGEWVNSDDTYPNLTAGAAGQNITLEIYNSSTLVKNITLVTDVSGQAEYCYMGLVDGNYSFVAYHPDDGYYTYISASDNFTRKHIKPNVTFAEDFVMDYRDGSAWNITLLGADGNPISGAVVKVGIAGKVYNRVTDDLGVAGLPINLAPGVYAINATYDGSIEYEAVFVNGTVTVNKAVSTLTAEDITLAYRNGSWIVTLTGAEGVIPKAGIKFGILGKVYTLKTDDRGVASLPINLSPGTYSVNATFDGNAKHKSAFVNATVTVERATAAIASENLTMHYKDGSSYSVTVTDANGAAVAGTTVKFSFGTKSYSIKTDANGVAALPINLNVGEYTVNAVVDDARYVSEETTNTIAVTDYDVVPVAGDVNMTYQDGTNYEVQLTTSDGTPFAVADLVVKITVLGKTYSIKTDVEGIAKLPINLKAGTYEFTAEYNGSQVNSTVVVNKA